MTTTSGIISLAISAIALGISIANAWMTLFQRGTVRMTRPAVIFFGKDERGIPKVFLRTLLISTAKRGRIVENLYVSVSRGGTDIQNFNIWVYGETKSLVRGSGLFVGESGVEANHHFLCEPNNVAFKFTSGSYKVDVYVCLLGDRNKKLLFSQEIDVTPQHEQALDGDDGLYFDWYPDRLEYVPHVDRRQRSRKSEIVVDD